MLFLCQAARCHCSVTPHDTSVGIVQLVYPLIVYAMLLQVIIHAVLNAIPSDCIKCIHIHYYIPHLVKQTKEL